MTVRLETEGIERTRGARKVLRDVGFALQTGDHLAVFGPNGAGKTTLLRLLALLDRPDKGSVRVLEDGRELDVVEARARMGFVTHAPMIYPDLSAWQNLLLYARLYGVEDAEGRVMDMLGAVGLLHRRDDAVRGFSRGMVQRMAIARALLPDPDILLLDEVYSGLDPRGAQVVRELVMAGVRGRIVVEVSHDFEAGYADCTHALLLGRGRSFDFAERAAVSHDELQARYRSLLEGGAA